MAARKAARTRKRNKAIDHRKSAKRVAAGKKAARTRKRRKTVDHEAMPVRRASRRRSSPHKYGSRIRRRAKHFTHKRATPKHPMSRLRRNPLPNPLMNPLEGPGEFLMGVLGAVFGYVGAGAADRWAATHALQGTAGSLMDQPAAGQIYNSESIDLPIYSNMTRLGVAAGAVILPLVASELLSGPARAFLQIAGFSALARTFGKAAEDFLASSLNTQPVVQQLYAPEIAAANRLATASGQSLAAASPNTFAGHPRRIAAPVGRMAPALAARQPQYAPPPQPGMRHVGDYQAGGGGWQPNSGAQPMTYNVYSACSDCGDMPVPNSVAGPSILPQPPGCDPVNGVVLQPNSPQPPNNCSPSVPNTSVSPPVPQQTALPQTPPPMMQPPPPMQPPPVYVPTGGNGNGGGSGGGNAVPTNVPNIPQYPQGYGQNGVPTTFGPQGQYGGNVQPQPPAPYTPR